MLRIPLRTLSSTGVATTLNASTSFTLPFGDYDGLVAKLIVATVNSGSGTNALNVYIQSSDDGGATFYDCASFATVSDIVSTANALWLTLPVNLGDGKYIGKTSNLTATQGSVTGLPLLTNLVRVNYTYGTMTATSVASWHVDLMANNQSPSTS